MNIKEIIFKYKNRIAAGVISLAILIVISVIYCNYLSGEFTGDIILQNKLIDETGNSLALSAGDYSLEFDYSSDKDFELTIAGRDKNQEALYYGLFSAGKAQSYNIPFSNPVDDVRITITASEPITTEKLVLHSDREIYRDSLFKALMLFIIGFACIIFCMTDLFWKASVKQKMLWTAVVLSVLVHSYGFLWNHTPGGFDGIGNMARIVGVADGLTDGQFPVTIFPYTYNGFGMMGRVYPLLFLYPAALLSKLHVSIFGTYQIMFTVLGMLSAGTMYISVRKISHSDMSASLASVFFELFMYHLQDVYYRNALGEVIALTFMPLVVAGIYLLAVTDDKNAWIWLAIGYTGIIQSHVISCVLVAVLSVLVGIAYIRQLLVWNKIRQLLLAGILTVLVNAGMIIVMAVFLGYGLNTTALRGKFAGGGVTIGQLFGAQDSGLSVGLAGIAYIVIVPAALIFYFKNKHASVISSEHDRNTLPETEKTDLIGLMVRLCIIGMLTASFFLNIFPWEALEKIGVILFFNGYIQFASRFLTLTAVCLSIAAAIGLEMIIDRLKDKRKYIGYVAMICVLILAFGTAYNYVPKASDLATGVSRITGGLDDTVVPEWRPAGSSFGGYVGDNLFLSNQDINITLYQKNGTSILCQYYTPDEGEYIDFPLFYYPGYKAMYYVPSNMDGVEMPLSKGEEARVRFELPYTEEIAAVQIAYEDPWYFKIGYGISILGIMICAILFVKYRKETKQNLY